MEMLFKLNPHIPRGDTFQEEGTEMQSGFSGKAEGAGKEQNALVGSGCSGLWHRGWADRNRWSQLASVLADHYKEFRYPSRKARYNGLTDVPNGVESECSGQRGCSQHSVFFKDGPSALMTEVMILLLVNRKEAYPCPPCSLLFWVGAFQKKNHRFLLFR